MERYLFLERTLKREVNLITIAIIIGDNDITSGYSILLYNTDFVNRRFFRLQDIPITKFLYLINRMTIVTKHILTIGIKEVNNHKLI